MRTPLLLMIALSLAACRKGDLDDDGFEAPADCNDNDANISPDTTEVCDQFDNNCDGTVDEIDSSSLNTWYADADADGYGDKGSTVNGCVLPAGFVVNSDDCDDAAATVHPGALEADCTDATDYNCDGSGGLADADRDGHPACQECDDSDGLVNPDQVEVPYNEKDDDCEAATRDDDVDGDGALFADDCDDTDIFIGPDAPEIAYDGVDNDCDPATSDDDLDGDGVNKGLDCDDEDEDVNPGGTEVAHDGIDQDCSGADDRDGDNDGADASFAGGTDCDDTKASVNAAATEVAYDGVDNDCDVATRDDDVDGDGFVKAADCNDNDATVSPVGKDVAHDGIDGDCDGVDNLDGDGDGFDAQADGGTDCDDTKAGVNPIAIDIAHDGIDNDCDGSDNVDGDNDGFDAVADGGTDCNDTNRRVNPDANEVAYDGIDNDCSPATLDDDLDADGVTKSGGDCNDKDATIKPSATDLPYDGIDSNCSGGSDYDADGDGSPSAFHGKGTDCEEANPAVTSCDGKSATTPAPSCLIAHMADPAAASGLFHLDPDFNTKGVFQAWCDMTTDGGGYTLLKIDAGAPITAAQMETNCTQYGMQLFVPRTYNHLDSAYKVAMDAASGPTGQEEYLYTLGVYPNFNGATCLTQPLSSLNPSCPWHASDSGPYFVHWNRNITEPNGDNGTTSSMYYDWTTNAAGNVRIVWHNDGGPPGYSSRYYMCDVGDKWGPATSADPKSCLAIKQANPGAQDGLYTINPDPITGPVRTYCDMAGGGWTLVAKGREGWSWDPYGQGAVADLTNLTSTAVVALPAWSVTSIAGKNMNTLTDGLRIDREEMGQSGTWKFSNLTQGLFYWDFTAGWAITYELDGVGVFTTNTTDTLGATGNNYMRIFTYAWPSHGDVKGWSTGCCDAPVTDSDGDGIHDFQDGWMFNTTVPENHAEPFTTVWIRR